MNHVERIAYHLTMQIENWGRTESVYALVAVLVTYVVFVAGRAGVAS